jgi:colicin import membrane protein
MPSALDRIDIAPPRDAGAIRSFGLALLIHAALIIALTWGVNWKRTDSAATFGAELWTNAPSEAAPITPAREEALPLPTPDVRPPVVQTPIEQTPNVDIALEQEKKRKQLKDQQVAQEKAAQAKAKLLQAQADKAEQLKAEQLKAEQLAKADAQKARQSQQAAVTQREDNMKRLNDMMAKAGGSPQGDSTSRATAGGRGSSRTYGAIAIAAIKPNVVFTEEFEGNPLAKVEVRLQSDGTIISSRLVQASGNKNWDNAVLNAVIRTRVMPKDIDGTLPDTILILEFKPRF